MSDKDSYTTAADSGSNPEQLRKTAESLKKKISELSRSVEVPISNLKGEIRPVPLSQAEHQAPISREELRDAMQTIILDKKLQDHDQHTLSRNRPDPETPREWFKALLTGKASIALWSGTGALSLRVLQIGLIISLIGFSVQSADGIEIIERAKSVELSLIGKANNALLSDAPELTPTVDPSQPEGDALADDAKTIANLRAVFRTAAANALKNEISATAKNATATRRAAFGIGAADARRAILAQSERPAAPSFDPGQGTSHFRTTVPSASATADVLDEAFFQRINTLKSHESTWRRLQQWAARPVAPDYVGEAFLRTILGGLEKSALHPVQVWSEQMSYGFVDDLIRGATPSAAARKLGVQAPDLPNYASTARDKRLFADFKAGVPERISAEYDGFAADVKDPGSLRRTSQTSNTKVPNDYNDLFPPASSPASGGSGKNDASRTNTKSPITSTRSYSRIRFSPRVGGVVIGRPADQGSAAPDVVALLWDFHNDRSMMLTVRQLDGSVVRLGPYHPAVVHHALAFVADGRVVVATLPSPIDMQTQFFEMAVQARRVVVHPTLEDTAFACNVIQIDRFVDMLTALPPGIQLSPLYTRIQLARSGVSALGQILSNDSQPGNETSDSLLAIQRHLSTCTWGDECLPIKHYSSMQPGLGEIGEFLKCLRDSEIHTPNTACLSKFPHKRASQYYIVDSGVQERPYTVDRQFSFVSGVENAEDISWPIQFVIQAVPVSPKNYLGLNMDDFSSIQNPWQFPTISEDVQVAVLLGVKINEEAQSVLRNFRDFVLLQRLFRTALNGDLGNSFPLDALVSLSSETKRFVKVQRNERWNIAHPLQFNSLRIKILSDLKKIGLAESNGKLCQQRISNIIAAGDRNVEGYFDFWRSFASLDADCKNAPSLSDVIKLQQSLRNTEVISEILALEQKDWSKDQRPLYCPAL